MHADRKHQAINEVRESAQRNRAPSPTHHASGWPVFLHGHHFLYPCRSRITHHVRGYTLVELVAVIVILGIVAAIAGPRFFGTKVFSERGYADEVASAMRYAQKIAVGSRCNTRFAITTAGYAITQQAASGNQCDATSSSWTTIVKRPDGTVASGTPPSDANVSAAATMTFDSRGAVVSGASNLTIGAYTLVLDAASGFVVVQ